MSDCCSNNNEVSKAPKKRECPESEQLCAEVSRETIFHHLKAPWKTPISEQAYYFCGHQNCDVVYLGLDNTVIYKDQLRTKIGVKESAPDALICYCFDVSNAQALSNTQAKAFVIEQTKNGTCSCATHNPSGKCCLKDFR